jgi:hypothetical protein
MMLGLSILAPGNKGIEHALLDAHVNALDPLLGGVGSIFRGVQRILKVLDPRFPRSTLLVPMHSLSLCAFLVPLSDVSRLLQHNDDVLCGHRGRVFSKW